MKNHLLRLAELIQDDFSEDLLAAFKTDDKTARAERLELISRAISAHRERADHLWLQAGKKRTEAERRAAAQANLASFVFGYLTGDAREYADSALSALETLGRQTEADLISRLGGK